MSPAKKKSDPLDGLQFANMGQGATVYTLEVGRQEAADLINRHGFRLRRDIKSKGVAVVSADKDVYAAYKARDNA